MIRTSRLAPILILTIVASAGALAWIERAPLIVARVDGVAITVPRLELAVESIRRDSRVPASPAELAEIRHTMLDELIATEVLAQEARRRKLDPSPAELDAALSEFKSRFFPDDAAFERRIAEESITRSELREDLARRFAIRKLLDTTILGHVKHATEDDARRLYDGEPHLRERLVRGRSFEDSVPDLLAWLDDHEMQRLAEGYAADLRRNALVCIYLPR